MANYFLLLDVSLFEQEMRPALTASWRQRSFEPCRSLCSSFLPRVASFTTRFHLGEGEPLIEQIAKDLPFDRDFWRSLVGELLFYGAAEIPEFQQNPDTLCCLLAPEAYRRGLASRDRFVPIQQAHFGSRDLVFGSAFYRPDACGYNALDDVARLVDYLACVDPAAWQVSDLKALSDLPEDEREDELAFAREWFPALRDLYDRARQNLQVVVHEFL